jgi:hypothetical protein
MSTYYFNEAVDGDWTNLSNWWTNSAFTLSASELPSITDDVYIIGDQGLQYLGENRVVKNVYVGAPGNPPLDGYFTYEDFILSATDSMRFYGGGDNGSANTICMAPEFYFYNNSNNSSSLTGTVYFYDNSANYGEVVGDAFVYFPHFLLGGTVTGTTTYVGYGQTYYFNNAEGDNSWGTLGNWWLDSGHTLSASELPGPTKDVVVTGLVNILPEDIVVNTVFFDGLGDTVSSNLDLSDKQYSITAQSFLFKDSLIYQATLSGNTTLFQSADDGINDFYGNVTLSGSNYTSSESTVHGNLFIHYPTIAGDLSLPTVTGTTTVVNYKFEEYPDYNFNISGTSNPSANTFYGYIGFLDGKHRWGSLDGDYEVYYVSVNGRWVLEWMQGDGWGFYSNQQNVDYPWNVTSWLYDYGDVTGTPIFNFVPFNKSNIVVSGIGDSGVEGLDLNGTYVLGYRGFGGWWGDVNGEQVGTNNNRPFYVKTNGSIDYEDWSYIIEDFGGWVIYNDNLLPYQYVFQGGSSPSEYYPTEITNWSLYNVDNPLTGTPVLRFADNDPIAERDAKYATATESGAKRFRRLLALGYV